MLGNTEFLSLERRVGLTSRYGRFFWHEPISKQIRLEASLPMESDTALLFFPVISSVPQWSELSIVHRKMLYDSIADFKECLASTCLLAGTACVCVWFCCQERAFCFRRYVSDHMVGVLLLTLIPMSTKPYRVLTADSGFQIGRAFVNKDGSINVDFFGFPVDGRFSIHNIENDFSNEERLNAFTVVESKGHNYWHHVGKAYAIHEHGSIEGLLSAIPANGVITIRRQKQNVEA
ncbi:MAG: hypothetical protein JXR76_15360 [Deltaproteobacteria bacterium]|nr:hypothetical protein [Deltaproteobacteria bacterium]